jgi:type I restriction enzyme, S subunit
MTRPNLNAVAILPESMQGAIGSTGFCVLRTNWLPASWLYYLVQTQHFIKAMSDLVQGVLYPAVRSKDITSYKIPVAPLAEQRRIVSEIEKQFARLDAAVSSLRRVQANLKRYRAVVLKDACEGRLVETEAALAHAERRDYEPATELLQRVLRERRARWETDQIVKMEAAGEAPKDDKWKDKYIEPSAPDTRTLPELPEGWTWALTQQIGQVQLGRQRSPNNRSKDYPTKYIRAANITEKGLDLSDVLDMEFNPEERERYRLQFGDIVLSEASGSVSQVGKPAIWRDELPLCCFQNTVIRLRPDLISSEYLLIAFKHFYQSGVFSKVAGGVGINHLSADKFSNIAVPIPSLNEQVRIVAEVDRRFSIVGGIEKAMAASLHRAETLRQKVLQEAFSGKLVGQNPQDEPASVLLERIKTERVRHEIEERKKRKEKRKIIKKTAKASTGERRKLVEVLRESEHPLTPEALFRDAGFKAEEVEAFYEELKQADKDRLIDEEKRQNGEVYLSART